MFYVTYLCLTVFSFIFNFAYSTDSFTIITYSNLVVCNTNVVNCKCFYVGIARYKATPFTHNERTD